MSSNPNQIYSATYSNVPVFEFVTSEGPIMRRKSDGWINATHILKIAKFPKAKRTRILEKDVQTGIHEKVQGGYGKYQGTYVPLDLGAEIARMFGVYEVLEPIFKFVYVEGKSDTPPPAPKHNHASASNIARRQQSFKTSNDHLLPNDAGPRKKSKVEDNGEEPSKKRGRPKRVPLQGRYKPELSSSQTVPISNPRGPSMGTFSSRQDSSASQMIPSFPSLTRQDTEKDALQIMASNLSIRNDDLELDTSADESNRKSHEVRDSSTRDEDDGFLSGRELFGGNDSFSGRESFEKLLDFHRRSRIHSSMPSGRQHSLNGVNSSFNGLTQYHHTPISTGLVADKQSGTGLYDYFTTLLDYFLHDDKSSHTESKSEQNLPDEILNPPEPLSDIKINQRVDNDGNCLLHWVCAMANTTLLQFLVTKFSSYIDLGAKNYLGESPLMFMVKFNNSFQQQNFSKIIDLLENTIHLTDNRGQTVLHHIANSCKTSHHNERDSGHRRFMERYANYYLEKLLDFLLEEIGSRSTTKLHFAEFLNVQDLEENTALHLFAYHLSKKCIKSMIRFHKLLNLELKNAVNHTVEDYLASHNYVLRIEDDALEERKVLDVSTKGDMDLRHDDFGRSQSFQSQLQNTKVEISRQNEVSNTVTEKLSELAYAIDRELGAKDEKLFRLYKCLRKLCYEKFTSQKANLKIFKLDYLVEDMEKEFESGKHINLKLDGDSMVFNTSRDLIIQEEIARLLNDMSFQSLIVREDLQRMCEQFIIRREKLCLQRLWNDIESSQNLAKEKGNDERLRSAVELQGEIQRRRLLAGQVYHLEGATPLMNWSNDDYKENQTGNAEKSDESLAKLQGVMSGIPREDKLFKYCKLIALSCGMSIAEVEQSIDLIEESLLRNKR